MNINSETATIVTGGASEFAAMELHFCSNSMVNGEVIRLDGAYRMPPA